MPRRPLGGIRGRIDSVLQSIDVKEDPDRLLSYYTRQQVQFLDAKLGCTYIGLQLAILVFIIGYIFIHKQGYLRLEQAKGAAVTHVSGDAFATSSGRPGERYFSIEDLTMPGLENGNIFIATRWVTRRQMRGVCEDKAMACATDADCSKLASGTCSPNGFCNELSWCDVDTEPEKYDLSSDIIQIWVRSFIQFVKLAPEKIYSTPSKPTSEDTFTVRKLLQMCDPIPVNYEEVSELGAVFEVGFRWDCRVSQDGCQPTVNVRRLDTILDPDNIGFTYKYSEYGGLDDASFSGAEGGGACSKGTCRVQNEVRGIRFFFRTSGTGMKASLSATITQASTSMTLISLAIVIADLLLTKVFTMRKKYSARKFEKTPDFSDYLNELQSRRENMTKISEIDAKEKQIVDAENAWLEKLNEDH